MRIGIIVRWVNPVIAATVEQLRAHGATVDFIYPDKVAAPLANIRVEHDLYLLKSATPAAFSYAGALHGLGAVTLNPYLTVGLLRNKIVTNRILQAAGVPIPETFVVPHPTDLAPYLEDGPLIVKPHLGSRGIGIKIVHSAEMLTTLPASNPTLAQRYHRPDQLDKCDHKLFRIGERVFGVRRVWPIQTYADKQGEPFEVTPQLRDITIRCGEAFGRLELYGLDVIISQGQPYVVDFNKFSSFMGVPNAPQLLADIIYEKAQRVLRGEPLLA